MDFDVAEPTMIVVFDDQGVQDAWQSNDDILLDLRECEWFDGLRLSLCRAFPDYLVTIVGKENLITKTSDEYWELRDAIKAELTDDLGEEDIPNIMALLGLVPYEASDYELYASKYENIYVGPGVDWRESLTEPYKFALQDKYNRDLFKIKLRLQI